MLIIQGGTVLTPETQFRRADVVVERGKIVSVGQASRVSKRAQTLDARGKFVAPGFIEAHCHVALLADGIDARYYDGNEMTDPVIPHLRALDAVHPEDPAFADLRRAGITDDQYQPW